MDTPSARTAAQVRMVDWRHLKSDLVWVYEGTVDRRYRVAREHHEGQSALLIRSGSLRVETEAGSVSAKAGKWVLPRQGPRLQEFSEDARVLSVHFNLYWPGNRPLFAIDPAMVFASARFPQLERQTRLLLRQVDRRFPRVANQLPWTHGSLPDYLAIQASFGAWLRVFVDVMLGQGVASSRLARMDDRVLHAVQMLDDLPMDVVFDARWLASEVKLSPSQLNRLFGKHFGLTPRQYSERRKLERAKDLIRGAPLSIKQIAYESGFCSLSYFSRWFHQRTGMSPRAFGKLTSQEWVKRRGLNAGA